MRAGVAASLEHFDVNAAARAEEARIELNEGMAALFDEVDFVFTATNPDVAFQADGRLPTAFGGLEAPAHQQRCPHHPVQHLRQPGGVDPHRHQLGRSAGGPPGAGPPPPRAASAGSGPHGRTRTAVAPRRPRRRRPADHSLSSTRRNPMAIIGTHTLIYTSEPEACRAVLRDVFGFHHVDDGQGGSSSVCRRPRWASTPAGQPRETVMCDDLVHGRAGEGHRVHRGAPRRRLRHRHPPAAPRPVSSRPRHSLDRMTPWRSSTRGGRSLEAPHARHPRTRPHPRDR